MNRRNFIKKATIAGISLGFLSNLSFWKDSKKSTKVLSEYSGQWYKNGKNHRADGPAIIHEF